MHNLLKTRFLRLLFVSVLLLFIAVFNSPIVAAQTLFTTANVSPQLVSQPLLQAVEPPQGDIVTCTIARSIDVYEQPSATPERPKRKPPKRCNPDSPQC